MLKTRAGRQYHAKNREIKNQTIKRGGRWRANLRTKCTGNAGKAATDARYRRKKRRKIKKIKTAGARGSVSAPQTRENREFKRNVGEKFRVFK